MALRAVNLDIGFGASFQCAFAWIASSAGVDPSASTPVATFRQSASDAPLVQLTNAASPNGQIAFLPPIPNFEWVPFGGTTAVPVTIYPIQVSLTVAGVALLLPYQRWSLLLDYPDGTVFPFIEGEVTVGGV